MNYNLKSHWEKIYDEKKEDEVSWFQKETNESIKMIQNAGIENPKIIDVSKPPEKARTTLSFFFIGLYFF